MRRLRSFRQFLGRRSADLAGRLSVLGLNRYGRGRPYSRIFHRRTKGTVYGVPALAGQTRFRLGSPSVSSRLQETTPCRLKPGLHTPHQARVCYRTVRSLVPDCANPHPAPCTHLGRREQRSSGSPSPPLEERAGERRPVTTLDAAVRGDIPAGCHTNISGMLAENDDLLSLPLSSKRGEGNAKQVRARAPALRPRKDFVNGPGAPPRWPHCQRYMPCPNSQRRTRVE